MAGPARPGHFVAAGTRCFGDGRLQIGDGELAFIVAGDKEGRSGKAGAGN